MKRLLHNQRKKVITAAEKEVKKKVEKNKEVVQKKPNSGRVKPGEVRNPSGKGLKPKQAGVPNKVTRDIKEAFTLLLEKNIDNLDRWFGELAEEDPAKAIKLMIDLAPYVVPRLLSSQVKVEQTPQQRFDLSKLDTSEIDTLIRISNKASISNTIVNNDNLNVDNQTIIDIDNQVDKKDE